MPKYSLERTLLSSVLDSDEFDDSVKYSTMKSYYEKGYVNFLHRAIPHGFDPLEDVKWLDVGCGTGGAFSLLPITHAIEPNPKRHLKAVERAKALEIERASKLNFNKLSVYKGHGEELSKFFEPASFHVVSYLRGFFQCRSDFEVLVAVNRVLEKGGIFAVDVPCDDHPAPIHGRHWSRDGFIRLLKQFGFRLESTYNVRRELIRLFMFRKVQDFGEATYNIPQLLPTEIKGTYKVLNPKSWHYWVDYNDFLNGRLTYEVTKYAKSGLPEYVRVLSPLSEIPDELM